MVRQWLSRLPKYKKSTILDAMDAEGYTAMHYAAKFNRFQIMLLLATSGACECSCVLSWPEEDPQDNTALCVVKFCADKH